MGKQSHIQWTDHTWNPWQGCQKVSAGCKFCYMYRDKKRYGQDPMAVVRSKDPTFRMPLKWKDPAKVFTCSWSDFFVKQSDPWRLDALEIIRRTPHLTYQILTKRPERVLPWMAEVGLHRWPENVWMGISAEDQETYEKRMPFLLEIPAAIRWISFEPLLGPIEIADIVNPGKTVHGKTFDFDDEILVPARWCAWCGGICGENYNHDCYDPRSGIDWIVTGGESGTKKNIRPAKEEWFLSLLHEAFAYDIAFFHKQNGGYRKAEDGAWGGRMLGGKTWNAFPEYFTEEEVG